MQPAPGDRIGPYEIRALIGKGGMGAVYRAYDARLRRDVALKFLHPSGSDADARPLILREARAVSALSHPNICTVHDVGDDLAGPYIAMEYLEGEPLHRQVPPEVVVRYGIQLADALDHAHSRGIIHRDLKPANIVATAEGRLKVLDFGLASRERLATSGTTFAATSPEPPETWGGTIPYMAPEILRGGRPDERSDLWALGVVLHQLASGGLPFRGETQTQVISAILEDPPAPLPPTVPGGLRTTIARLLARDPAQRFHSAGEVRAVLEALQETAGFDRSLPGPSAVAPRSGRWRPWTILAAAACLALVVWLVARNVGGSPGLRLRDHQLISTLAATHGSPSFAPDADLVAFVAPDDRGIAQLWVQNLAQGAAIQITSGEVAVERPRWSPAGDQILFNRTGQGIWSVAPLGGTPHRVLEQGLNANFTRDGRRIVYERQDRIWTANADGSDARLLEGIPAKYYSVPAHPAWSPDGRWIVYFRPEAGPNGDLWLASADGGEPRQLTTDMREGGAPVWTPDGTRIVFSSARAGSRTLWQVGPEGGEPVPLTTGAGEDDQPDISRDGRRLVYANVKHTWELRVRDTDSAEDRVLLEKRAEINFPQFSPDGSRLVFFGREGRAVAIFTTGVDGTDLRQLTAGTELNHQPRWSADGGWVYFYQTAPKLTFRRVPAVGGPSEEVLPWRWETYNAVQFSPSGDRLVYTRRPDGTFVRNQQTGVEHALAATLTYARWSRDGRFVAGTAGGRVVLCPAGGEPCRTIVEGYLPAFSADGSRIYFLQRGSAASVHRFCSVDLEGRDLRLHGELGPFRGNLDLFYDVSSRGAVAWGLYREGRRELWAASLD